MHPTSSNSPNFARQPEVVEIRFGHPLNQIGQILSDNQNMSDQDSKTRCVRMVGPDKPMDMDRHRPVNELPVKCSHCTFPDLDYVPRPYLLAKDYAGQAETSSAELGNFLVRERVKCILEIVVPGACAFYQTAEIKSKKLTAWWLAVPNAKLPTIRWVHQPLPPRCSKCGEPRSDWGDKDEEMINFDSGGVDIFKTLAWSGDALQSIVESDNRSLQKRGKPPLPWSHWGIDAPPHAEYWTRDVDRDLYFSVRLEQLLKRAKVKGQLVRYLGYKDVKPSAADQLWVGEKYKLLAARGLTGSQKSTGSKPIRADKKWFHQFLIKNRVEKKQNIDFAVIEKKEKLFLPQDYKDFVVSIGVNTFADVNDMEGSTATLLIPAQLDFKDYRRGKLPDLEGDDAEIDGVMFATVDSGDVFVFDVRDKGPDYPVYFYNHEENTMEPFAANFAECIKRFAQQN